MCNANKGTEKINEELKYKDLDRCFNSPISELLTIIIEEFLPRRYKRYVEMNVFYSSGFKKYQSEIPSYLWNRPKIIVDDILKKMGMVSPEMITSIKPVPNVPEVTYFIEGSSRHSTEKKVYHVSFGTDKSYVSCSCPQFRRNRLLFKHFFAVIESGYRSFEDLTSLRRNHPLHIIDEYLFEQENENDYLVRKFIFSRSHFKYNLAVAFVLSYYQQKPFFISFCSFPA